MSNPMIIQNTIAAKRYEIRRLLLLRTITLKKLMAGNNSYIIRKLLRLSLSMRPKVRVLR